jgi:hypothetical protein
VGIAVGAAPAAADSGVIINGAAASPSGSPNKYCAGPTLCVTLTDSSPDPNTEKVSIESETPGASVTGIQAEISVPSWSGFSRNGPCFELNGQILACSKPEGVLMQDTLIVSRENVQPSYGRFASVGPLISHIDVGLKGKALSLCDFPGRGARAFGPLAKAADRCTPPSRTRITQATIKSNSASFRFKGRLAKRFQCVLYWGHRRVLNSSCHSPKSGTLPSGHYKFEVFGVNRAGFDPKPATKSFSIR